MSTLVEKTGRAAAALHAAPLAAGAHLLRVQVAGRWRVSDADPFQFIVRVVVVVAPRRLRLLLLHLEVLPIAARRDHDVR